MAWPEKMPLLLVTWVDSMSDHTWQRVSKWNTDIKENEDTGQDALCMTVGWLFKETDLSIYLFSTQNYSEQLQGLMQIPLTAVRNRKVLSTRK